MEVAVSEKIWYVAVPKVRGGRPFIWPVLPFAALVSGRASCHNGHPTTNVRARYFERSADPTRDRRDTVEHPIT